MVRSNLLQSTSMILTFQYLLFVFDVENIAFPPKEEINSYMHGIRHESLVFIVGHFW